MKPRSPYHLLQSIILRLSCRSPRMTSPEHNTVHMLRLLMPFGEHNPNTPWRATLPHLEDLYAGGDMQLYSCVISDIMFHKESPRFSTSNHEYLVAQVDLEGICVGFVRMERTVDHTRKDGSSLSIASTSSSGSIPAPDQITICGPGHLSLVAKSGEMISSYKPLDPLPFAALVAACSIVSTHEPLYRLLTSQCYWYAGLVSRLLIGETGVARRLANAQRNEGVWQEFLQVVSDKTMVEMANMLRPDYVEKLQKLQYMPQARRQKRLQEAEADRMLAQAQAGSAPVAEGL